MQKVFEFLVISLFLPCVFAICTYENCPQWLTDPGAINVHVIAHTHDDAGWLKTADDYYTGVHHNEAGGNAGVQYIINTVIDELEAYPNRKFSYCETGYMTRWLEDHNQTQVNRIIKLNQNGQLEFVGGGWVQPDEAASHYIELVDQYTLGLRTLDKYFGNCSHPIIGWQLDPFGHSREHSNLLAMMGYKALFFNRENTFMHNWRKDNRSIEFLWSVSDDLGNKIFTQSYDGLYCPPSPFNWDQGFGNDPVVDNKAFENFNADKIYSQFSDWAKSRITIQLQQQHVMLMEGCDFWFSNADTIFENMDRFIRYAATQENTTKLRINYSTPRCYYQAVQNLAAYETQSDFDFFPYASGDHSYWTGYFTSKPAHKGLVRQSSAYLQLVRGLSSVALVPYANVGTQIEKLERSIGLSQHHDAITGTSKDYVTFDYSYRIFNGTTDATQALNLAAQTLSQSAKGNQVAWPAQTLCRTINESECAFSTTNQNFAVTIYNGNDKPLSTVIRIPVFTASGYQLQDNQGNVVSSDIFSTFNNNGQINNPNIAPYSLYAPVSVGPLGFQTYFVAKSGFSMNVQNKVYRPVGKAPSISNGNITLTFDANGYLASYTDATGTFPLRQEFFWYQGTDNSQGQASGAYVFRPTATTPNTITTTVNLTFVNGTQVTEARQVFSPWISQTVRLYTNKPYVEFEWTIGPIPNADKISKEVITRYTASSIASAGTFYTDANGRQLVKRVKNYQKYYTEPDHEPVSQNYYPINSRISISDATNSLTVLTDRSHGGTSLTDGTVEIMLHRRDFYDDGYGVDQALDEPGRDGRGLVIRGKHWLVLTPTANAPKLHRPLAYELFHQPVATFSTYDTVTNYNNQFLTQFTGIATLLPPQIHLLTLKPLTDTTLLLRLENIYQKSEDPTAVSVDLSKIFATIKVNSAQETNLQSTEIVSTLSSLTVTINPMEIKTYIVQVQKA